MSRGLGDVYKRQRLAPFSLVAFHVSQSPFSASSLKLNLCPGVGMRCPLGSGLFLRFQTVTGGDEVDHPFCDTEAQAAV